MAGGVFTAPETGVYHWSARGRAADTFMAEFVVSRNSLSETYAIWTHDRSTGTTDEKLRNSTRSGLVYLTAGDTLDMRLKSGTAVLDNTSYFTVVKAAL